MRWVSLVLIIVPAIYFGYMGKPTEMGLAIIAGSLASAFLNLDKFTKIKGAGFEAEMKKVVNEAYATIGNLKGVAKTLCDYNLFQLVHGDRFSSNINRKTEHKKQIITLAKELDIYTDDHKQWEEIFFIYHSWDLYGMIALTLFNHDQSERLYKLKGELERLEDRRTTNFPSKETIENIFINNSLEIRGETRKAIDRFLYYVEYGELTEGDKV